MISAGAAVIVPDVGRIALDVAWQRYALIDRGSYDWADLDDVPAAIVAIASDFTGRRLRVSSVRAVRLRAGDYLLAHHDRGFDEPVVEAMLDLSDTPVPGAEVHYRRRGAVFFRAPGAPGSLAIVERGPAVTSNHTYVSKRFPDADIVRLVAILRDAR